MPIEYGGKICYEEDCSKCEKCIFDEDINDDFMALKKGENNMANIYGDNRDNSTLPKSCNVFTPLYIQCQLL